MSHATRFCAVFLSALLASPHARGSEQATPAPLPGMDGLAESYVRLVLAIGELDPDMVDAYYGPPKWREDAKANPKSLDELETEAARLDAALAAALDADPASRERGLALRQQVASVRARLAVLRGERLPFDEEARRMFGVTPPQHDDAYYAAVLRDLDAVLPGEGPLPERMEAFRQQFVIPDDQVDAALRRGLEACRDATRAHVPLPEGEDFELRFVHDKPWGAYNWYQGNYHSLIEVNRSLPTYASSASGLMCHEGYPGHHVLNTLLEERLVKGRGWVEYTIYPLFSAQSLLAEGTANFGAELVFPGDALWAWERERIYPLAGIDPGLAATRQKVAKLSKALEYASIDAARAYLDGRRTAEATVAWLQKYALQNEQRARQSLRFYDKYRSYIVSYRLGEDLARSYVDRRGGTDPQARWNAFVELLVAPPSIAELAKYASPAAVE